MTAAITLWEAYLIETPLAKGLDADRLLAYVVAGDRKELNAFDDTFDYDDLIESYKKDPETIETAIKSGYTVKFISIHGIKRLVRLKFGLIENEDYVVQNEEKLIGIPLNEEQLHMLKEFLSPQWHVDVNEEKQGSYEVNVAHVINVN